MYSQDLEANEARVTSMNGQAGKLLAGRHPDADVIGGRKEVGDGRHRHSTDILEFAQGCSR